VFDDIDLPGGIVLTSAFVDAVRSRQSLIRDLDNPVCTLALVTSLRRKKKAEWSIIWFPRGDIPAKSMTTIGGVPFALSPGVEEELRGKVVDFVKGEVRLSERRRRRRKREIRRIKARNDVCRQCALLPSVAAVGARAEHSRMRPPNPI
jgi:hypothetical protein